MSNIYNSRSNTVISGSSSDDSIDNTGSNTLVNCGNGNDSVSGGGDYVTINGGVGNDRLELWGTKSIINGDSGDDWVFIHGKNVTVNAGDGNDSVENWDDNKGWQNGSVVGGAGYAKIFTGSGNDFVRNYGVNATINTGTGDDSVNLMGYSKNSIIQYTTGDGNDTIWGYNSTDTIHISGSSYSTQVSGNDIIIKVDSGSITLKDAKSKTPNIKYDSIVNDGWATINSSSGSNILSDSVTIASGSDVDDTIHTKPIDHTVRAIYGNAGNDLVSISGNYGILWSKSTINSGNGNDSIYIKGDVDGIHPATVSIDSGAGDDLVSIYGGYGNGIHGGTTGLTVSERSSVDFGLGDGNDSLFIKGLNHTYAKGIDISNVKISGDNGDDLISIYGSNYGIGGWANFGGSTVSIDGGNGADTIAINSIDTLSNVSIVAGADDVISVGSGNATYFFDSTDKVNINGLSFTADFANSSAKLQTSSNAITIGSIWNGSVDIANGSKLTDVEGTVKDVAGSYSIVEGKFVEGGQVIKNTKNNVTISSGAGDDSIDNTGSNTLVNCGNGNDSVSGGGDYVTINGGVGNDRLELWGTKSIINGDSGDDWVFIHGKNVTVNAGDGNDSVENWDDNKGWQDGSVVGGAGYAKIFTGSGNDFVRNYGVNATINTGTGDDSVNLMGYSKNSLIQYANGDGNDTIYGYTSTDTIQITNSTYTTTTSGNDVIINVGNGSMTLKDATGTALNIVTVSSGSGISISNSTSNTIISGTSGNDSIENDYNDTNVSINAGAGNDYIFDEGANTTINGGVGDDTIAVYGSSQIIQYANGDGNDIIKGMKTSDTIQITSGTYTTQTSGNDVIINVSSGSMTLKDVAEKRLIIQNANGTIDTLNPNGVVEFFNSNSNVTLIGSSLNDTIFSRNSEKINISGGAGDDLIEPDGDYVTISGGAGNDSIGTGGNYVIINGGKGNDSIESGDDYSIIKYNNGDGNDTIYYYGSSDTIQISGSSYSTTTSGNNVIINVGNGSMTLKDAAGMALNIMTINNIETLPAGLKYNTDKTQITVSTKFKGDTVDLTEYATTVETLKATSFNKVLTINGNDLDNTIKVGKATTVYGGEGNDTIMGGKGTDELYGEEGNDKLKGGSAADTLIGGEGNDTLTGGAGKDVFVYESGNDIITDYKAGQDSIMIEDEIDSVSVKGSNVIFTIGDGQLTVKGGKNKRITFIDSEGEIISNDKYKKSTKIANFVEESDADSDYWFAIDDNVGTNQLDNIITQTTCANSALDITAELTVDYSSLNKTNNKAFIAQSRDK